MYCSITSALIFGGNLEKMNFYSLGWSAVHCKKHGLVMFNLKQSLHDNSAFSFDPLSKERLGKKIQWVAPWTWGGMISMYVCVCGWAGVYVCVCVKWYCVGVRWSAQIHSLKCKNYPSKLERMFRCKHIRMSLNHNLETIQLRPCVSFFSSIVHLVMILVSVCVFPGLFVWEVG